MAITFYKDQGSGDLITIALWSMGDIPFAEGGDAKQPGAPAADPDNTSNWGLNNQWRAITDALELFFPKESCIVLGGNAYAGTNIIQVRFSYKIKVNLISLWVGDVPMGADMIWDANVDGTSIFNATPANRPKITDGNTSGDSGTPDTQSIAAGKVMVFDCDQVGSTTPGGSPTIINVQYIPEA